MKVSIFISGSKFLCHGDDLSESLVYIIKNEHFDNKPLLIEKADEVKMLKKICKKDKIEHEIEHHLSLKKKFAKKLKLLDSITPSCLKPISPIGEVLKEVMIDEYELVLKQRNWLDNNELQLDFEAVDYAESPDFIRTYLGSKKIY